MVGRATVGNWEEELERVLWFVGNEGLGVGAWGVVWWEAEQETR